MLTERAQRGAIVVHDRYHNYDCAEGGVRWSV